MKLFKYLFLIYFIFAEIILNAQYVGVGCMYDYNALSVIFDMDCAGNITVRSVIPTGGSDRRVVISKEGLVLIANNGYFPPDYLSISVLKINDNGDVYKVRDIDLGGKAIDVKITKDGKCALVNHEVLENGEVVDLGISVLEITDNNDVITPPKYFFSNYPEKIIIEFDITSNGLILGLWLQNVFMYKINKDGEITDTGQVLSIPGCSEIVITPDDKLALLACASPDDLYVLNINDDTITYSGTSINVPGNAANGIVVTPNSRVILESLFGYVAVYDISELHNVTFRQEFFGYEAAQSIGMTPDGNFAVVSYDFTPSHGKLSSFRIYPDGTVLELKKEAMTPSGCVAIAFYQLPQTSVETNWQMYK